MGTGITDESLNTTLFGGGTILVWGCISLTERTDLIVLNNGNFNAERYILNILEEYVVPYTPYIGPNFLPMQDKASTIHCSCVWSIGIDTTA